MRTAVARLVLLFEDPAPKRRDRDRGRNRSTRTDRDRNRRTGPAGDATTPMFRLSDGQDEPENTITITTTRTRTGREIRPIHRIASDCRRDFASASA